MAEKSEIKQEVLTRVRILYILFILFGVLMALRIFWIQLVSNEVAVNSDKIIHGRIFQRQDVKAHRGTIFARNGEPLATSIVRYQVDMDFGSEGFDSLELYKRHSDSLSKLLSAYFRDRSVAQYQQFFRDQRKQHYKLKYLRDTLVRRSDGIFSRFFDMLRGESMRTVKIYDTIRNHRPVKLLPRVVDYAEWQTLKRYPILNWNLGMTYNLEADEERIYMMGDLASRTVGKINKDRGKDYGIEAVYNDVLQGQDGEVWRQRIARGFYGRVVGGDIKEAVDGMDLVTTIDLDLQDLATHELKKQLEKQQSEWGTTVIMEVETGDILAIANIDRNRDGSYSEGQNRALGARAEPGSTFKLASTMALLEVAKMPTSKVYDSGDGKRIKVGSTSAQDSHKGYSEVTLRTAFEQSLNVYFAKATYEHFKDDPTRYTDFLKSLHLDKRVGFDAFGEREPFLPEQGGRGWWPHVTLVNLGYGYGLELTPMQILTLYNGVANNGRMMRPRLVKEITKEGRTVESFDSESLVEKMASQQTIDTLKSYMRLVTAAGTANWYLGRFTGFEAAAKTGTAQFAQSGLGHKSGYYLGTMVGYMPVDKPKYSVITSVLKAPGRGTTIYGAGMTGPVMQSIMQGLYNRETKWHTKLDTMARREHPTSIKSGDVEAIKAVAEELLDRDVEGASEANWGRVEQDSSGEVIIEDMKLEDGVMPSVYGLGLRDALFLLESRGYRVSFTGEGKVWRQNPRAGTKLRRGSSTSIQLR